MKKTTANRSLRTLDQDSLRHVVGGTTIFYVNARGYTERLEIIFDGKDVYKTVYV
ncbi:MAG TPA: hypothetical protein VMZ28_21125 [Kofleriaceae bacterium]|nr:hypothetical protein [Kofleriaceae bacterium]